MITQDDLQDVANDIKILLAQKLWTKYPDGERGALDAVMQTVLLLQNLCGTLCDGAVNLAKEDKKDEFREEIFRFATDSFHKEHECRFKKSSKS